MYVYKYIYIYIYVCIYLYLFLFLLCVCCFLQRMILNILPVLAEIMPNQIESCRQTHGHITKYQLKLNKFRN